VPTDPLRYQCAYCGKRLDDRDDIPRHEAKCELKEAKRVLWNLMIHVAYARERTNGKTK